MVKFLISIINVSFSKRHRQIDVFLMSGEITLIRAGESEGADEAYTTMLGLLMAAKARLVGEHLLQLSLTVIFLQIQFHFTFTSLSLHFFIFFKKSSFTGFWWKLLLIIIKKCSRQLPERADSCREWWHRGDASGRFDGSKGCLKGAGFN